ncbi:transposon Tf2-9 polyprotein [Trichonephila clavipes]|nr:transposon Tf2-9 polyprotein [Trichonephila clavipes]
MCVLWNFSKIRNTPYPPSFNGLVERTHRSLKATPRWTQVLPFVLLGLRSVIKEDINVTAELVYGTTIRLPAIFSRYGKPLQPPYDGPFIVVKRSEKLITLQRQGKEICVSIDRVKPAFMLSDTIESNQPSVIPNTQEVHATQTTCSCHRVHFPQKIRVNLTVVRPPVPVWTLGVGVLWRLAL